MLGKSLNAYIPAYKKAFASGEIQKTYQSLVGIVQSLRTEFSKMYKGEFSIGNIRHGYIDFTYFYLQIIIFKSINSSRLSYLIIRRHALNFGCLDKQKMFRFVTGKN